MYVLGSRRRGRHVAGPPARCDAERAAPTSADFELLGQYYWYYY